MHHFFDAITNTRGDALIGYYVRLTDSVGNGVSLYADANLTPIISVSGVADAAQVDSDGNVDFYVASGTYTLNIYATDSTTLVKSVIDVPMLEEINSTGTLSAATRSDLASTTGKTAPVYLQESGREGTFVWSSANNSANVTADPQQGIYAAPASDTTGASGAWVRKFSAPLDIRWFGSVADCTAVGVGTDNAAAITAAATLANALGNAGIFIPRGRFRVASRLAFTTGTKIVGEGFHENPGSANGTTYTGVNIYDGSILVFDADVGGMIFYEFTDNSNAGAVTFPADHKYKSARYSAARDFMLYGGGGVTVAPHGIEIRTVVTLENVRCDFFAGSGFHIEANTSGTNPYGIADGSKLTRCIARANKLHGFRANGNDANVIHFDSCDSANNGGAGYLDNGQLGNTYTSCHAATNNQSNGAGTVWTTKAQTDAPALTDSAVGSYITSSGIGPHTFIGCYSETGSGTKHEIVSPSVIVGGNLASTAGSASASATTFNGGGAIAAMSLAPVPTFGTTLTSTHSVFTLAPGSGSPAIKVNPGSGSFSGLQLLGTSGSSTQGLDVSAGLGSVAYSSDTHIFRNAAQNVTFGTFSSAGLNLTSCASTGAVTSSSATAGIGYATGAGGAVTQATSRTTGVTLNKICGAITLVSAAGSATWNTFTVTNSAVAATDTVEISQKSGANLYNVIVTAIAAGSFNVSVSAVSGTATESPVFNFVIVKAVAA